MASLRSPTLLLALACGGLVACLGTGEASTTRVSSSGAETFATSFEGGFDEGGEFAECEGYLQACASEADCICYLECVADGTLSPGDCLDRCLLAEVPHWAQQGLECFADLFGPDDTTDGQGGRESTTGLTGG